MYELIYTSAAKQLFDPVQLSSLLKKARAANSQRGVTGILLYQGGSFLQVLEGAEEDVRAVYDHVATDPRHWRLSVLRQGPIEKRNFENWSMGFVSLDTALLGSLTGRHSLMSNGTLHGSPQDVEDILDRFRSGQWHRYVHG